MKISLVVPVKNEAASIHRLLDSLSAQTRQPDEVIFVDGGSTDNTPELIESWARTCAAAVRVIRVAEATPGKGRNIGIEAARFEWVALTDAGIRLEPDWLAQLAAVAATGAVVIYGNYEPVTDNFFEHCAALAYVPPKQMRADELMRGPSIASAMLQRLVWVQTGGFPDLRAAEDLIFMERLRELGCQIGWASRATVWWQLQPTFRSTFRKFVLYSRHNVRAGWQRYWHYGVARQYAVGLVGVALALLLSPWWLLLLLLGGLARAAKSIWTRRENHGFIWLLNPVQLVGVAFILLTIDVAMFLGWWQAWRED